MQLLGRVNHYLKATNTPPSRFGRDAVGDPRFVWDLRRGREPRPATIARVVAYLERSRRPAQ